MIILRDNEKLKETIGKKGYSYRELAKKSECSQTCISLILKGERNPSPKLANKICEILQIDFDDYFFICNDYKSN